MMAERVYLLTAEEYLALYAKTGSAVIQDAIHRSVPSASAFAACRATDLASRRK